MTVGGRQAMVLRGTAMLLGLVVVLTGCAPVAVWQRERKEDAKFASIAKVERLPPTYDPLAPQPPYAGPHPSTQPFRPSPQEYPVRLGAVGPVDRSLQPLQYPFACQSLESDLGPPLVDNQDGIGTPVYDGDSLLGHSRDCAVPTRAAYYYKPVGSNRLQPYTGMEQDVQQLDRGTHTLPFIVRIEQGTINRFLYLVAVLADPGDDLAGPSPDHWNGILIYNFRGGVGIGKRQGRASIKTATRDRLEQLAAGYGVVFSSGTATTTHYNMRLAVRTAAMVKAQFVALYGTPEFTIGIGASGGAVQQYLAAEQLPGLLDGLIPQYSYPDMITQTIWALDCELLEYYFDVTAHDQRRWRSQTERTLVMGLAADNQAANDYGRLEGWARALKLRRSRLSPGATECARSWRGLIPLTNNPTYTNHARRYAEPLFTTGRWSHWHDLRATYGVDTEGFAHRTYSNVGVQYGLKALQDGALSMPEFVHLNASIGSWKPPAAQRQERYWLLSGTPLRMLSLWSDHNMYKTPGGTRDLEAIVPGAPIRSAPRARANPAAIQAAFAAGEVFQGRPGVPIIDVRHYLDDELDMHHSFASLSARSRIIDANGQADGHLIWVAERSHDPTPQALDTLVSWLRGDTGGLRSDACFDADGRVIAEGARVWDGPWNGRMPGACMSAYPAYQSPRNAAGEPMRGDTFACVLEPVAAAAARGAYAGPNAAAWLPTLEALFPDGVCRYDATQPPH